MLTQLTSMIVALSLALTASSVAGWPSLSLMFEGRSPVGVGHESMPGKARSIRASPLHIQGRHEAQVLSFGP